MLAHPKLCQNLHQLHCVKHVIQFASFAEGIWKVLDIEKACGKVVGSCWMPTDQCYQEIWITWWGSLTVGGHCLVRHWAPGVVFGCWLWWPDCSTIFIQLCTSIAQAETSFAAGIALSIILSLIESLQILVRNLGFFESLNFEKVIRVSIAWIQKATPSPAYPARHLNISHLTSYKLLAWAICSHDIMVVVLRKS